MAKRKPPHRDIKDNRPNPPTPRDPLPELPWPDIFDDFPELPERVYIVGSGPKGERAFHNIPENAYCIALNSRICFWRKWDVWMAFDHRIVDSEYWTDIRQPGKETKVLFGARLANRIYEDKNVYPRLEPDAYFRYHPGITGASFVPGQRTLINGVLRGLTVAGCALQFAYYGGADQVVLCGVDMFGQNHVDGHVNIDKEKYGGVWPWAENMSKLCAYLISTGMRIGTVSDTAITGIERWQK